MIDGKRKEKRQAECLNDKMDIPPGVAELQYAGQHKRWAKI